MTPLHPSLTRLRSLAGGDASAQSPRAARHVARCARCRELADWTRGVADDLAAATALQAPGSAWSAIERRVREGDTVLLPASVDAVVGGSNAAVAGRRPGAGAGTLWTRGIRRAAVLVLAAAGTAAALAPGSPVRRWAEAVLNGPAVRPAPDPAGAAAGGRGAEAAEAATFIVEAEEGGVRILVERPAAGLRIRVRIGAGPEAEVTATGAAASARFARAPGRLTVSDAGPGELLLVLPEGAGSASVEVDGQAYLRKEAGRLVVLAPATDTAGSEVLITVGDAAETEVRP